VRILFAVLASVWFMPVSCTAFMVAGSSAYEAFDARDAARGDAVHSSIAVVTVPAPVPERPFGHVLLGRVPDHKERHPEASFLMPAKEGSITPDLGTVVSYKVVSQGGGEQVIETRYQDGDRSAWGRYRAGKRDIMPLESRLSPQDYVILVGPVAFIFALLVFFGARMARPRSAK